MIERWLAAVRDDPARPTALQCHVLTSLALRMNWRSGTGYVSTGQLVADSTASESTVRRATAWAQFAGLLEQTRRGQRLGNGQVVASEWRLTGISPGDNSQPVRGDTFNSQPVTGDRLGRSQPVNGAISTGQSGGLNRSRVTALQELELQESSSSRTRARDARSDAPRKMSTGDRAIAEGEQLKRELANSEHMSAALADMRAVLAAKREQR